MKVNQFKSKGQIGKSEIFRFIIVGGVAVVIDGICYTLMVRAVDVEHGLSKRVSFVLGSIWAFLANKHYTFRSSATLKKEMILFSLLYLLTFMVNGWMHDVTLYISNLDWLSFLSATATSTIINFFGQKFIVFRKS